MSSVAVLLASMIWQGAAPAGLRACSYGPPTVTLGQDRARPDGPIVLVVLCDDPQECRRLEPRVDVLDGQTSLAGELQTYLGAHRSLTVTWTPAQPLTPGRAYRVFYRSVDFLGESELRVTVDADLAHHVPDPAEFELVLDSDQASDGPQYCCGGGFECQQDCNAERLKTRAVLRFVAPEAQGSRSLQLYRVRAEQPDGTEHTSDWGRVGRPVSVGLEQPADRFCATLEILDLLDGARSERQACVDAGSDSQVGAVAANEPTSFAFDCFEPPRAQGCTFDDCPETPGRLVAAWCRHRLEECRKGADFCDEYDPTTVCEAHVDGGVLEGPNGAGRGDDGGTRDTGIGENPGSAADAKANGSGCQCAVPGHRRRASSPWLLAGGLAALAVGLRARRPR